MTGMTVDTLKRADEGLRRRAQNPEPDWYLEAVPATENIQISDERCRRRELQKMADAYKMEVEKTEKNTWAKFEKEQMKKGSGCSGSR